MARTVKDKPTELWMAKVTTTRLDGSRYSHVEHFGPFTRRGDAVGAGTRARRRSDLYEQKTEYFSTDCEWKNRL
jgi:hypothetical protein